MKCWPWTHDWDFINIASECYHDYSTVLYHCKKCNKFKTQKIKGSWGIKHKYEQTNDKDGNKIIELYKRK